LGGGIGDIDIVANQWSTQRFVCDQNGQAWPAGPMLTSFNTLGAYRFYDFLSPGDFSNYGNIGSPSGGSVGVGAGNGDSSHPGQAVISTGNTINTGYSWSVSGTGNQPTPTNSAGAWRYEFNVYLSSTSNLRCRFGLLVSPNNDPPANGMWIQYDSSVNGDWHTQTVASSTITDVDSSVAVSSGQWYRLTAIWNGKNALNFYINGVQVSSHTTNLYNGNGAVLGANAIALASSSPASVYVDSVAWGRQVTR